MALPRAARTQRRTRIQEAKEEQILEAALEVFSLHGFRGATVDQIAEVAGMSKPNLLYYFRTKEAMHRALITRVLDTWLDPLREFDAEGNPVGRKGRTTLNQSHRHEVEIYPDETGRALSTNEHEHAITSREIGGEMVYAVDEPQGFMRARVPQYGKLRFLDRSGVEVPRGISVGSEWTYRSFIEGGTRAAAIWTFTGIDESVLRTDDQGRQVLPLELIVRVFRTYKGDIESGIQGLMQLQNPDTKRKSDLWNFTAKDASINSFDWQRKLDDENRQPIDLIDDLVTKDGRLEVIVQCLDRAQYYGFAQPDAYIRLPDGSPLWNFIKAQISIWVQMVLVIAIAVTCSTAVNGPVAMMFTLSKIWCVLMRAMFARCVTQ